MAIKVQYYQIIATSTLKFLLQVLIRFVADTRINLAVKVPEHDPQWHIGLFRQKREEISLQLYALSVSLAYLRIRKKRRLLKVSCFKPFLMRFSILSTQISCLSLVLKTPVFHMLLVILSCYYNLNIFFYHAEYFRGRVRESLVSGFVVIIELKYCIFR